MAVSMWVKLDSASYLRAQYMLEKIDRSLVNLEPAWHEMSTMLRARQIVRISQAAKRADKAKTKGHQRYILRKASGKTLNGRGDRAAPGAGPLTVTGRVREALIKPQTLDIRPLEMYMGVKVRDASGKYAGDVGYIVPLQDRFNISKMPSAAERTELSHVILRRIEAIVANP